MNSLEINETADSQQLDKVLAQNETIDVTLRRGSLCWLHRPSI